MGEILRRFEAAGLLALRHPTAIDGADGRFRRPQGRQTDTWFFVLSALERGHTGQITQFGIKKAAGDPYGTPAA